MTTEFSKATYFYHGTDTISASNILENDIDLSVQNPNTDFGKGFYLTSNIKQAKKRAKSRVKFILQEYDGLGIDSNIPNQIEPVLLKFIVNLEATGESNELLIYKFDLKSKEWFFFVANNRGIMKEPSGVEFLSTIGIRDVVYGPMLDGKPSMQKVLDEYKENFDIEYLYEGLSKGYAFPEYNQLSFHSNSSLVCLNVTDFVEV